MSMTAMGISLLETAGKPDGSGGFIAIPLAEVAAYTQAPLGFTHLEPASSQMSKPSTDASHQSGDREWIYVYNNSVIALAAGTPCFRNSAPGNLQAALVEGTPAAPLPPSVVVGVAQHTIPAGFCGFILRSGAGKVNMDGATAASVNAIAVSAVTDYTGGPVTATVPAFGYAVENIGGAGLVKAILACKG